MGYPGSGKSTVARSLSQLGVPVFDSRDALTGEMGQDFALMDVREKISSLGRGESVFHRLHTRIDADLETTGVLVIDSFKASMDPVVLGRYFPTACIEWVAIECPLDIRISRIAARNRRDDARETEKHNRALREIGIDELISTAHYLVRTDCSITVLDIRVRQLGALLISALSSSQVECNGVIKFPPR